MGIYIYHGKCTKCGVVYNFYTPTTEGEDLGKCFCGAPLEFLSEEEVLRLEPGNFETPTHSC